MLERIKRFISLFAQGMILGNVMDAQGGGVYIQQTLN
jgi:hypothetical protein